MEAGAAVPRPGQSSLVARFVGSRAPAAVLLVRLLVGGVFLSEGIQKFVFPDALGVGRFAKIGIPAPGVIAPFVGVVEVVFGLLLIVGLLTRLATIPLLIDILVAIATTKIPMLLKEGFWKMAHEARTDYAMLLGLIFLLLVGAGPLAVDSLLAGRDEPPPH
jgi:putative oxidoreductase